jgi:hypothetical protein
MVTPFSIIASFIKPSVREDSGRIGTDATRIRPDVI